MARKSINTTLDSSLYSQLQMLALQLSAERNQKIHVNDLLEEGMKYILKKYAPPES
ncbi:hypothetical protein [Paenibacillus amylolyticus]|uniref:hypothetical protein n=1 Tax=Paenibacillus amylolyticus TaxID=1451 RepID=UPI001864B632|nr:hypothetical protein [Paenibacillus amylolyticus]